MRVRIVKTLSENTKKCNSDVCPH